MHRTLLPLDILVGLFALSALTLGVFPSYDPGLSHPVQMGVIIAVLVYYALAHGIPNREMGYLVGRGLMLAGMLFSAGVILQYAYQGWGETPGLIRRIGAIITLLPNLGLRIPHPNAVATFVEVMIPLGIVLAITSHRRNVKALWIGCTLVCAFALLLTFSRGAFVGLAATGIVAAFVLAHRWPLRLAALLLLIVGAAGLLLTSTGADWVLSRWVLYRNSLFVASDYLYTGIGLGDTFPLIYSRYGLLIQVPQLTYPHNLLLSVWMGQGLPGLLSFAALIVVFYLFVWKAIRLHPRRLFHAAWLGVTVNLIHGLFDSRQYVEALWLMPHLFGLIGLTVGLGRLTLADARSEKHVRRLRYIPWRLAAVGAVVLIAGIAIFNRQLQAAWYTNRGALLETRTELNGWLTDEQQEAGYRDALVFYRRALEVDPQWPNANRRVGNLHVKMGHYGEAVTPLETALHGEPDNPAAVKGLGLAYMWNGRITDAAHLFLTLHDPAEMNEELTQWGFYWGSEQNQPLLSAYAYETAAAMYPDSVSIPIWQAAADAYRAAGQIDKAREWYERILVEEPNNLRVAQALAEINGE
jgi:O-antigen ligase